MQASILAEESEQEVTASPRPTAQALTLPEESEEENAVEMDWEAPSTLVQEAAQSPSTPVQEAAQPTSTPVEDQLNDVEMTDQSPRTLRSRHLPYARPTQPEKEKVSLSEAVKSVNRSMKVNGPPTLSAKAQGKQRAIDSDQEPEGSMDAVNVPLTPQVSPDEEDEAEGSRSRPNQPTADEEDEIEVSSRSIETITSAQGTSVKITLPDGQVVRISFETNK